jgi:hypothetical protein
MESIKTKDVYIGMPLRVIDTSEHYGYEGSKLDLNGVYIVKSIRNDHVFLEGMGSVGYYLERFVEANDIDSES